jgi:hypothetical protein
MLAKENPGRKGGYFARQLYDDDIIMCKVFIRAVHIVCRYDELHGVKY